MTQTIEAVYDGTVLRPEAQLQFAPNTRVRLVIESIAEEPKATSFLKTARSLALEGPSDWATNIEDYLNDIPD